MLTTVLKKSLHLVVLLLGITLLSFCVIHLAPGRPVESSGDMNPKMTPEVKQQLIRLYDLDKPLMVQYGLWVRRLLRCDFGRSFADGRPVTEKLLETIPVTLAINGISLLIILGIGIPLGIFGALHHGRFSERLLTIALFAGMAMPTFWLALVLMDLVCVQWGLLPISGLKSLDHDYLSWLGKGADIARHLILPIFVSSVGGQAGFARDGY
jgi:peptide/nickel transport system permease protein